MSKMAYEYQETIKEELEFTDLDNTDNQDKMLKELEEVYQKAKLLDGVVATTKRRLSKEERKAKAFDELVKLYPQKDEIPSDEFFDEMERIIKEDE